MHPSKMLQRTPVQAPPEEEPVEDNTSYVPPACTVGIHYTSEAMEEDFSTSVELLMNTPRFLMFLQDADKEHDLLSERVREALAEHIATIEDFTGQWLNRGN